MLKELALFQNDFCVVELRPSTLVHFGMWHISRAGWANSYNEAFTSPDIPGKLDLCL